MSEPRRGIWRGWGVLAVSSAALVATSPGQTYLVSLFNLEMQRDLGLSAAAISGAYMVATLSSASLMTAVGKGSDRFGPGRFMVAAALGLWLATWWMVTVRGFITLAIGFFLLRFFGQGSLSLASGHALAMWFERRLGIAEGIRLTIFGLGILVLPSAVVACMAAIGWRATWPVIGSVAAATVLLLVLFVHQDRPEQSGDTLDDLPPEEDEEVGELSGATLSEAMRRPAFWVVAASSANSATLVTAFMFHVQPLAVDRGLDVSAAPGLIAAYALLSTSLFFLAGWLGDRLAPRVVFATAGALYTLGAISFISSLPAAAPYLGMAAMGSGTALLGTSVAATLARTFGRAHHGAIRGMVSTIGVAGTAIGPFILGVSVDWTGSFDTGVAVFVTGSASVAASVVFVRFS